MSETSDQTTHKGRPKKVVTPEISSIDEKKPEAQEPIAIYITRAKKGYITVIDNGQEKYFHFSDNGVCGVLRLKNKKNIEMVEKHNTFGSYFFRIEDESKIPSGSTAPRVVIGARNALTGQLPNSAPIDTQLNELIIASQSRIQQTGRLIN